MKDRLTRRKLSGSAVAIAIVALQLAWVTTGCESDNYTDHKPPAGDGSLVVDNHTGDDISIFVDGAYKAKVDSSSDRILDMAPGLYRVVLTEEDHGDRSYRADVDILDGRLTVLEVWISTDPHAYDVTTRFE